MRDLEHLSRIRTSVQLDTDLDVTLRDRIVVQVDTLSTSLLDLAELRKE